MSITIGEGLHTPRGEGYMFTNGNEAMDVAVQERLPEERIYEGLHRALALTADQALSWEAYNTFRTNREGQRLPGGEMVVWIRVAGKDVQGNASRRISISGEQRGGLDEDTITLLGAEAQRQPKREDVVL